MRQLAWRWHSCADIPVVWAKEARFGIFDWTGNRKYPDQTFASFEAGWDFLMSSGHTEEDLGEFYVEEIP